MTTGGLEAKEGGGLLVISAANTAGNLTNGVTLNGEAAQRHIILDSSRAAIFDCFRKSRAVKAQNSHMFSVSGPNASAGANREWRGVSKNTNIARLQRILAVANGDIEFCALQCDAIAMRYALLRVSLPSLGVSSLDLGPFNHFEWPFFRRGRPWR